MSNHKNPELDQGGTYVTYAIETIHVLSWHNETPYQEKKV
jgi:hypothetical protein